MALLVMEGFDDGMYAERVTNFAGTVSSTYGKHGNGLRGGHGPNGWWRRANTPAAINGKVFLSFFACPTVTSVTEENIFCAFSTSANKTVNAWQCHFYIGWDHSRQAWRFGGPLGTFYSADDSAPEDAWYHFEVEFVWGDSTSGTAKVWVDGTLVLNQTGVDTAYNTVESHLVLGGDGSNDQMQEVWFDDIVLWDDQGDPPNTTLGIVKVETVVPSGNGNSSGLTGSDSNQTDNYLLVDDTSDSDWVEGDTEGDKDTYAMGDITGTESVYGIEVACRAQKTAAGTKYVRPIVRSGSTDYAGDSQALIEDTWDTVFHHWGNDPDTSASWTVSGVNAIEAGLEVRDS